MPPQPQTDLEPRRQAAALLTAALARRGGLDEAATTTAFRRMEVRDRAFARATALTALRRQGVIDRALDARLTSPPPDSVVTLLRLALAQAWFMDVPAFAAVNTAVELAPKSLRPLVNGVLRRALAEGPPTADPEANAPAWLFARWSAAYGVDTARAIAARIVEEPPTDLTPRDPADAAAVAADLEGQVLAGGTVRTPRRGDLTEWPGYPDGRWWVQDAAAAVPARLLNVQAGETALDLCAAPGGKALQLAAAGASVTAVDRSTARLGRLHQNLERTKLSAEVVAADAGAWPDARSFDAVLLDAPCTSTGTFRRNPDVLWAIRPSDVAALAKTQGALLDAAARRVRPGGRLVYCVCSLEPEEGEAQAEAFAARSADFAMSRVTAGEGGAPPEAVTANGHLRILPSMLPEQGGLDGFFVARFRRHG